MSQWDYIVRSIIHSVRSEDLRDNLEKREERERPQPTGFHETRKRPNSAPPRQNRSNEMKTHNFDSRRRLSNEVNSFHPPARDVERHLEEWNSVSEIDEGDGSDTGRQSNHSGSVNWDPRNTLKFQKMNQGRMQSHRAEILADKKHWKKIHSQEDQTALSSIASTRLQQYLDTPFLRNSSHQTHRESNTSSLPSQRTKKIIPKDAKILSSGSSSLEIANAFLQSHLGQDLVQNYHFSESHDQDSDHDSTTGDGRRPPRGKTRHEEGEGGSRAEDKEFYKAYYSQDWQSRKGGWVGDFGPPHTHPLSIRQERETSLNSRKY